MNEENLPEWASLRTGQTPDTALREHLKIDVDADAMYEALLSEYREFYDNPDNHPGEWLKEDGTLYAEWEDALKGLEVENPTAYWLEVAYQSMKLDLQMATRRASIEIRVHDPDKAWAQKDAPDGRDVEKAIGGPMGDLEARGHYERMRGYMPSPKA